ncbi:MAG: hypothetical protein JWR73_1445 [Tardiphaga sp.]|nr:hypothetical protein [Tardiphaga sp.]
MKLFIGWVATAGVLVTTAAEAQVPEPYRLGAGAAVTVSDVGGPYAALPPDLPPGYGPPRYAPPPYALSVLPPREIFMIAREMGYQPLGAPQQRGLVYTLSAINIDGEDGRLVLDARNGRIMRFMPAYRMGNRMGEETVATYGPAAPMPELPQYRRPQPGNPLREAAKPGTGPRVASRSPTAVPLPKKSPAKAVATPAKPVVPAVPVAVTPPAATPAAPVEQQAVAAPKPDEVRVIPMTATPSSTPPETPAAAPAAPTVAAPATEAKPAAPATDAAPPAPPAQGVE